MGICMLAGGNNVQTVNPTLSALVIHPDINVMSGELGPKGYRGSVVTCARAKISRSCRNMKGGNAFALHFVMFEPGAISQHYLNRAIGEIPGFARAYITLNHRRPTILFANNKNARKTRRLLTV
jgi:hypothetical protein